MRALVVTELGAAPELRDVPEPVRAPGEALIELHAASINPVDLGVASGRFFAGAPPVRVFAECIAGGARYRGDDNVAITLRFADGSIGTVIYTAAGDDRLPKERLEIFGEGGVAILEDFRTLELARGGKTRTERSANQDKGFAEEMKRFLAAVREGGAMPIPFEQSLASSRATLAALDSLRRGAPVAL